MSRMLSVNPQERPLPLSDLPRQLLPVESTENSAPVQKPPAFAYVKRWWLIVVAAVAAAAVAIVAVAAFRSKTSEPPPPAQDDFSEMFSSDDVFQPRESGK